MILKEIVLMISAAALLNVAVSAEASAMSQASCKVSWANSSGSRIVIETPNLPVYESFSGETCRYFSSDNRVRLGTSVLKSGILASVSVDGNKVIQLVSSSPQKNRVMIQGSGFLTTGEQLTLDCSYWIDPAEATSTIVCP